MESLLCQVVRDRNENSMAMKIVLRAGDLKTSLMRLGRAKLERMIMDEMK